MIKRLFFLDNNGCGLNFICYNFYYVYNSIYNSVYIIPKIFKRTQENLAI